VAPTQEPSFLGNSGSSLSGPISSDQVAFPIGDDSPTYSRFKVNLLITALPPGEALTVTVFKNAAIPANIIGTVTYVSGAGGVQATVPFIAPTSFTGSDTIDVQCQFGAMDHTENVAVSVVVS
jgi:hypothetical protein